MRENSFWKSLMFQFIFSVVICVVFIAGNVDSRSSYSYEIFWWKIYFFHIAIGRFYIRKIFMAFMKYSIHQRDAFTIRVFLTWLKTFLKASTLAWFDLHNSRLSKTNPACISLINCTCTLHVYSYRNLRLLLCIYMHQLSASNVAENFEINIRQNNKRSSALVSDGHKCAYCKNFLTA